MSFESQSRQIRRPPPQRRPLALRRPLRLHRAAVVKEPPGPCILCRGERCAPLDQARLLNTLLSGLEGMLYRCRDDGQWTMEYVSEGCFDLTGYRPSDLLLNSRVSYEEITHPDDRGRIRDMIRGALARRERFNLEYRILRADGEVRWVWERGAAVFGEAGEVLALEGFIQDITRMRRANDALRGVEQRYRNLFENAVEGIFQSTPEGRYLAANPALARIYGYDSPAELMRCLNDIGHQLYVEPQRRDEFMRLVQSLGVVTDFESQVYRSNGEVIWISENSRAVFDDQGNLLYLEGTVEDITARRAYADHIEHQATHDGLTGLPNRTLLYDRLRQALMHSRRHGTLTAVAFVDLDQFKIINDSLGHQVGDELLKTMAARLTECVRHSDTVARQGGDEFVLVLTDQADEDSVSAVLQRVLEAVSQPWEIEGRQIKTSCSIGASLCPADGDDAETLLRNADAAMYRAKELGRNNAQFYSGEMNAHVAERLDILSSLHRALENDEFLLHYQPKFAVDSGRLVGVEALVRWHSPERGMVPPDQFIGLAEDSGLINAIGEWVLRRACAENRRWQEAGLPAVPVAVNISPRQLRQGRLSALVAQILAETGLAPHHLELEITENVVMHDADRMIEMLHELKALGVKISVDDFGTGYSSLSYLKRFPLDHLKIDKSFVRDIASDPDDAAIAEAIISLGHILDLRVLAEGVETAEQLDFLRRKGCDEVQGFFFSRPLAAEAFEAFFTAQAARGESAPADWCL